ncbi:MAG TPA: translocation/assembly module TamB domain-containing protein [Thermoanaerobaculia bacterium]|nr:translocation/assembly module TamB domain-containing protein [Thermoanaerobaculia bacterium]
MSAPEAPPPLARIAPARLFGLLFLFAAACGYAVYRSERFQRATRTWIVRSASAALERPVSFDSFSVSFLPPGIAIKQVRVAGAPGEAAPFFEASEAVIGGRFTLIGRTLTIGSISLSRPRAHVTIFPDGTDNLPPGLRRRGGGGLKVRIGRIAVTGGTFIFDETRIPLDLRLHGFVAELAAAGAPNAFRGRLGCRVAGLALGRNVKVPFDLDARFDLGGGRLHVDDLSISGAFGRLHAIGEIPDLSAPVATAWVEGSFDLLPVERLFALKLPFRGAGTLAVGVRAGKGLPVRVTGRAAFPKLTAQGFTFDDVSAIVTAGAEGLTANIEKGGFDGGDLEGALTISRFDRAPQDFGLVVDARRISVERFFGNIDLPGTRLAGAADLVLALRWRGGDIERADGAARLSITPAGAGVPLSGGGPVAVRNGFIDFEKVQLRFPASTLALDGGFALGVWKPRFRFAIASDDFRSLDAVATNFSRAIARRPVNPYGLAGSGTIDGTLGGTWSLPEAELRIAAENAEYSGLRLGTVYADVSVADQSFLFHPLRSYDGDSRLSLSGTVRYAPKRGSPDFAVTAEAGNFPVERVLKFFALDFPVTGRVTGTLPVSGTKNAITGGGEVVLERASVWGQPIDRVSGRLDLTPGTFALRAIRGQVGDSLFGGEGSYGFAGGTFSFRISADDLPLSKIAILSASEDYSGDVSFHAEGSGTLERPTVTARLQTRRLRVLGREVPEALAPSATLTVDRGALDLEAGAPGRWTLHARGPLTGRDRRIAVSLAIPDLAVLSAVFPAIPRALGGEIEAAGSVELAPDRWEIRNARAAVSRFRVTSGGASLASREPFDVAYGGGRVTVGNAVLEGPGTRIEGAVTVDTAHGGALGGSVSVAADLGNLERLAGSDATLSGDLQARLTLAGTLARPLANGRATLAAGRYKSADSPYVLDAIAAEASFAGDRLSLDAFRARLGGGDLFVTGDAQLDGYSLKTFRLVAQAQNVTFRSFEDLNLQANADLTAVGTPDDATVRGEVTLISGTYTKDFAPTLASLFGKGRPSAYEAARETWQDRIALDVHVVSSASLEVRNNLARLTASVDLLARGTLANPVLLGQITIDEGGKITLQDVKYEILSGTITFGNPSRTEPVIDVTATAEVKGYAINAQAVGTLGGRSRVQFNLSSDPPLSNEQIANLLLTGTAPESAAARGGESTTASSVVGSIAGLAIRPVTSRVQQLFRLDRFQVDPVLQSTAGSGGAVITIGKNLSKDLSVTYSYSAETNAQSIILVEYQIDANKVLQASKDENNVFSIGVKFRKRF